MGQRRLQQCRRLPRRLRGSKKIASYVLSRTSKKSQTQTNSILQRYFVYTMTKITITRVYGGRRRAARTRSRSASGGRRRHRRPRPRHRQCRHRRQCRSQASCRKARCRRLRRSPLSISISILWGYPYLSGLHYKGGLHGISLSSFLLMCPFFSGPIHTQDTLTGTIRTLLDENSRVKDERCTSQAQAFMMTQVVSRQSSLSQFLVLGFVPEVMSYKICD